jgi:hypothetical protein
MRDWGKGRRIVVRDESSRRWEWRKYEGKEGKKRSREEVGVEALKKKKKYEVATAVPPPVVAAHHHGAPTSRPYNDQGPYGPCGLGGNGAAAAG